MLLMGLVMIAIYVFVYSVPYAALSKAVAAEEWKAAVRRSGASGAWWGRT